MSEELAIVEAEEPKLGTVAWLQTHDHVDWEGLSVPAIHRIPAGATRATEPSTRCQVLKPDGERCGASATKVYGICVVHAGGGGPADITVFSQQGRDAQARMKVQRKLLGVGAVRVGSPRQRARIRAAARADEIAEALVDGVLDAELPPLVRQQAVVRILDETEPLQLTTVEVELPTDAAGVSAMGWAQMQQLAAQLLSED